MIVATCYFVRKKLTNERGGDICCFIVSTVDLASKAAVYENITLRECRI